MSVVTTTRAFYEAILDVLREGMGEKMNPDGIYLAAAPIFDDRASQVIQVSPGGSVNRAPKSALPLIDEDFRTILWFRSAMDRGSEDTEKLTNATWSAFDTIQSIRKSLIGSDLNGLSVVPVQFIRTNQPVVGSDQFGWIQIEETYRATYRQELR